MLGQCTVTGASVTALCFWLWKDAVFPIHKHVEGASCNEAVGRVGIKLTF
jgi:hypothetical protein